MRLSIMTTKKRVLLVDSNSIIHRAYHAYPKHLATSTGFHTNAIFGFFSILFNVIKEQNPDYVVCAFDVGKPTHRIKKFKEYKGTRKPTDKELILQIPIIKEILSEMDLKIWELPGHEADDIIGTLSSSKDLKSYEKIIVTGDRDLLQLVEQNVQVLLSGFNQKDSVLYDRKMVKERMDLEVEQVIEFKGLRGDPSDNIPGVRGIGEKGARDLLEKYPTLEKIFENIEEIENRYKTKLENEKEMAFLSRELATIERNLKISSDISNSIWGTQDTTKVRTVLVKYELNALIDRLNKLLNVEEPIKKQVSEEMYVVEIKDKKELNDVVKNVEEEGALFLVSTGKTERSIFLTPKGVFIATSDGPISFLDAKELTIGKKLTELGKIFQQLLLSKQILKIGFNLKKDMHDLQNLGLSFSDPIHDVKILEHLIKGKTIGLEDVLEGSFSDSQKVQQGLFSSPEDDELSYLIPYLRKEFINQKNILSEEDGNEKWNIKKLFEKVEMPLISVLYSMEREGIGFDKEFIQKFAKKIAKVLSGIQEDVYKYTKEEFNINSPQQLSEVLFKKLKLPASKRKKSGIFSTDSRTLEKLRSKHKVVAKVLEYRKYSKILSTYTTAYLDLVDSKTQRIHTTYNQDIVATGRLSSTNPNMQNIPISDKIGREVRRAFVVRKGHKFVSFDYSQQELRILAHLSKDKSLIGAFKEESSDIHKLTASKIFSKPIDKVSKEERSLGKTINFGIMYGMGSRGLAESLEIEVEKAKEFIEIYFEEYSSVKRFYEQYIHKAEEMGYATTMFGRRRSAMRLSSESRVMRSSAWRELINFPIQGTAADMMKLAMIDVFKLINDKYSGKAKMLLQIHDEIVLECSQKIVTDKFLGEITDIMENTYKLRVPVVVDSIVADSLYK